MKFFKIYEKFTCHQHKILKSNDFAGKNICFEVFLAKIGTQFAQKEVLQVLGKINAWNISDFLHEAVFSM